MSAVLLVMFIVYRMRKKDEGTYTLSDEPKRITANYSRASTGHGGGVRLGGGGGVGTYS